ncbi:thiamine pyrophosphate-dependent enzyme [Halomicrococcus sp. NG-SE-24]|uniref:thiamine pyrophosphate-dependent enzyme n=1 Tax=Halomicrococcus sp. NG-SE-24 TaxID=3436928 RepID=UPI003D986725
MTDQRADQYACTEAVLDVTPDAAIVSNLGVASYVLASVSDVDRARNFYQWGSMGVTTAVGLGLALSTDDPVTVLEGDGSLLMSLGVLSTVARYNPSNLTIVLWDNEVYETTGGQPTHASHTDFAGVAENCGLTARTVHSTNEFADAYRNSVSADGATLLSCAVDPVSPDARPPFDYPAIARRVRDALTNQDTNS